MKKIIYKLLPVVMLLLMLTTMFTVAPLTQAADADNYYLTVNFDAGCDKVWLTIPGESAKQLENGVAVAIPKINANVTLRVELIKGYEIVSLMGTGGNYRLNENCERTWTLNADDVLTLTCRPKIYTIDYLSAAEGEHDEPVGGSFPDAYTFGEETRISLPTKNGFIFECWVVLSDPNADISTGQTLYPDVGEDFVTLSSRTVPNTADEILYLKPKWKAIQYEVYRYDYIYAPLAPGKKGAPLFDTTSLDSIPMWLAGTLSPVNGNMGDDRSYPGFEYIVDPEYYSPDQAVMPSVPGTPLNIVYRLYKPLEYALEFRSNYDGEITFAEGVTKPDKFKFDEEKAIPNPIRTGYIFTGWTVTVVKNQTATSFSAPVDLTIDDLDEAYAGDKDSTIILTANWKSEEYVVHIDLNTGSSSDLYDYDEKYVYESGLEVTDPTRSGYTFSGWLINGGTELKTGSLPACAYTAEITLVAQWTANEYTVTFDGNGGTVKEETEEQKVIFDTALNTDAIKANLPTRDGHHFLGFTLTPDGTDYVIDENGNFLPNAWTIAEDTVLYAQWEVIFYNVTVNVSNAEVWLNGQKYEGVPLSFAYGTEITVIVNADATYKVVKFNGAAIDHATAYTGSFLMDQTQDVVLDIAVLKMAEMPNFRVDYINEIFTVEVGIPDGNYRIVCGEETLLVKVQSGEIYIKNVKVKQISIPETFFGKTATLTVCGDGIATADSDALEFALAARPEMPKMNDHIKNLYFDSNSVALEINLNSAYTYVYEFALYYDADGTQLVYDWTGLTDAQAGKVVFGELHPGTIYYIYVRVKAADGTYPHGEPNILYTNTSGSDYKNDKIAELEALRTGGTLVDQLINQAIEAIKALTPPSATFYTDIDGIYNGVVMNLPYAKSQDGKIAELRAFLAELLATKEFSDASEKILTDLCNNAIDSIVQAETEDEALSIYNTAKTAMKQVKISYLVYEDLHLTANAGLEQGTKLYAQQMSNINELIDAVNTAIQTGKISVAAGSGMTLAEAVEMLRSLDVMAGYTAKLSTVAARSSSPEGAYVLRLLLPEALRGETGLTVAYYDQKTGVLEILPTERDGDYLTFSADVIEDFVILGDPTMNLTGILVSLAVILLCQLIAIVWILIRRAKYVREMRHYSVAAALLLTIRFLPDNALTLVMVLGGLVILFQIILMYLLISSDVFYRRKRRNTPSRHEDPDVTDDGTRTVMAPIQDETLTVEEDIDEDLLESQEDLADLEKIDGDAESFDSVFEDGEFDEYADAEELSEPDLEEIQENDEDEYGFIEPAINPRYSLPDEEFAEFDPDVEEDYESDEATAEEASYDEAAEWAYDDEAVLDGEDVEVEQLTIDENGEEILWEDGEDLSQDDDAAPFVEAEETDGFYEESGDPSEWSDEAVVLEEDGEEVASDEDLPIEAEDAQDADEAEAAEELEPEFYIEPDATGDQAPAPDYSIYSEEEPEPDESDATKQYDGYEE